jgi:ribosomal 30S subunit maturation factor RimM
MEGLVTEGREVFIAPPTPTLAITEISEVRRQGDSLAVRFRGIDTGWQARELVGRRIQARTTGESRNIGNESLVGFDAVFDDGEACGAVSDILELKPPAPPVLVITGARGELLVPLVDEFVTVDVGSVRVVIRKSAFSEQLKEGAE